MVAYNNAPKIVGKSAVIVLFVAVFAATNGMIIYDESSENLKAQKKFFKKNIDFEDGWTAEIVACQ